MEKTIKFEASSIKHIDMSEYDNDDYMVGRTAFLSTRPNSHDIVIPEDVLREYAPSVLGKWVTAEVKFNDCTTHTNGQSIVGIVPKEQDVEFVEADDGYLDAYVDCIISKRYAKEYCNVFSEDDAQRSVSIEAKFSMIDEHECDGFDIKTITTLGRTIRPSVPDANITIVRFSEEDAENYYSNLHKSDSLSNLKQFVEERKQSMAEKKTYKIDKSKEAMSTADWGDYDKISMRDKIMDAKNRDALVKSVYLLVEDGWKDAPSEHLKYPVMMLDGDKFIYNRNALSSALAYAKQNDETEVVNKIEAIYKKLDLDDDSERKEGKKMAEIEFSAVNIDDLWGMLWAAIEERWNWKYGIQGIYEEDNKKFAIVTDRAKTMYRLDFSLTEDGLTLADEVVEVKQEFTETDNIKRFAEPENVAEYRLADCDDDDDDEHEEEMSADEMKAKMAELEKDIESRDNIIMEKDAELEELRKFKAEVEEQRKAATVESIMAECKEYMSDEQYKEMREEGMACKMSEIDGWTNKVKAVSFSAVKKNVKKTNDGLFRFAAPIDNNKKSNSVWDRI
uniref:Uncharacterized protein n=1 Tax=Siphoviridae sp. ctKcB20 TaxID=2827568 RepID=A0A8S5LLH7_9CAUD|nr:MAG TPA: hypothetical protein [Siphoviridae sp. ctKcB20]